MSVSSILPLDWIGITNTLLSYFVVGVLWLGASAAMGSAFGFLALGLLEFRDHGWSPVTLLLLAGLLWVGAEELQAILLSLYMLGAASDINAHFTLASIGYAFASAQSEFWIASARWGGVPLLSFFVALFSTSVAQGLLSKKNMVSRFANLGFVITSFVCISTGATYAAYHAGASDVWRTVPEHLTVVAAQTSIEAEFAESEESLETRAAVIDAVRKELKAQDIRPDVLIFPEGIGGTLRAVDYASFADVLPTGSLLIHSSYPPDADGLKRVQTHARIIGGSTYVTEKQFLMPYGEYPPYYFAALLRLFAPETYRKVMEHRQYVAGTGTLLGNTRGVPVGVRVCSEIFSPLLYRTLATTHAAGLLVHTSSIGIFQKSSILSLQMRNAARIRAVENGLPIVQAMNMGSATAFDCRGKELLPVSESDIFKVYEVPQDSACPVFENNRKKGIL
jgi:apolipoprotein N-acyltransferase